MKRATRGSAAIHWARPTPFIRDHLLKSLLTHTRSFIVREPHYDDEALPNMSIRLVLVDTEEPR